MSLDEGNFLSRIKQIVTGTNAGLADDGGFLIDSDVSANFVLNASTLTSTSASTVGPFYISRDYDQVSDNYMLRLTGSTNVAGNPIITFNAALQVWAPGTTASSTFPLQTSSTQFVTGQITNFGIDLSGNGLQYGDVVKIALSTSNASTSILGATETYSSCLVAYADYLNGTGITTGIIATEVVNGSTYEIRTR